MDRQHSAFILELLARFSLSCALSAVTAGRRFGGVRH
jgi:hypothetical protein